MFVVERVARGHSYLYLVESVREGKSVRQRTIKPLGRKARLQQWNPERYDNGTIEDWKITVFSEPFEDFLIT